MVLEGDLRLSPTSLRALNGSLKRCLESHSKHSSVHGEKKERIISIIDR